MTHKAIVPFKRWHLAWLEAGGPAADSAGLLLGLDTLRYLEGTACWTAAVDGHPVACGGFLEQWPGRALAWMYLNKDSGPHMRWLTREVERKLDEMHGRLEMTVRADFKAGHRWAKMLGFHIENPPGLMEAYGPEGEAHVAYVRLNG